jgi:succinate dehydrogenase/fumarate reductase cytochrome b subunit
MKLTPLVFHRWNSVFLGLFIVLHFATHLTGVFGIEAYNGMQNALRVVYRNPIVEPVLLLSVLLQIGFGLQLLIRKTRRGLRGRWAYAQVISGFFVLFFLIQHL